jgi:hypothetical protein
MFIPTHCYNVMILYLSGYFSYIRQQIFMVLNIEKSKSQRVKKIEAFLQNLYNSSF